MYHNLKLNHSEHEKTLYHTQPLKSNYYMILHNGRKVKGKEKSGVSEQKLPCESGTKALQQYYATADNHKHVEHMLSSSTTMLQLTTATTPGTKALQQYHYATADNRHKHVVERLSSSTTMLQLTTATSTWNKGSPAVPLCYS
jgi:hypothetical protein